MGDEGEGETEGGLAVAAQIMIVLRLTRSATTPPSGARNRVGPSWANTTSPTKVAWWVSRLATTARVTFCIHVPMFDAKEPRKTQRKARWDKAPRGEPGRKRWVGAPALSGSDVVMRRGRS